MHKREFDSIEERLDFIEFRQELNFYNLDLDRIIFEYGLTKNEFTRVMNLMDNYREKISNNEDVNNHTFEVEMYEIVDSEHEGDYHMCEAIVKGFYNEGRWEEVFTALYGDFPKYSN
ncbi:MAG: DUF1878 domain-containing protein [Sedimentibacter sp.]|uniref:DUF1878 domain-containing protein n=1 Tax=Sedimentibacter sp. TaxID=1960295 RepID=UPI002981E8D5|nr:DUF1878 domain-containing protein [Sedimentibacter sp.]MDW5300489.1 DUF1878 domain-containing protein [Sedimentibacter sp.]